MTRPPLDGPVPRALLDIVLDRMPVEPVIALEGARTVGKSTLLRELAKRLDVGILDLDDISSRATTRGDPSFFVSGPGPVLIDEYQHVPSILDAIKAELNRDGRGGRFIITGSTRWDALPPGTQSLTGRIHTLPIRPLTQAEIERSPGLIAPLLDETAQLSTHDRSATSRTTYIDCAVAGGFPAALARPAAERGRWFDGLVRTSLERDTRATASLRLAATLPALLAGLAAQTGQVLHTARAAQQAGLNERSAANYVHVLERLFLVQRLPAWGNRLRALVTKSPKLHVVDSGLAARLLHLSAQRLATRDPVAMTEFGHLLETFVHGEVATQASWRDDVRALGHWRTNDGKHEVDIVIERDDGAVVGIEVKAGGKVDRTDARSLLALRDLIGPQFLCGLALYTGPHSYRVDDKMYALPIDRLWTG